MDKITICVRGNDEETHAESGGDFPWGLNFFCSWKMGQGSLPVSKSTAKAGEIHIRK